MATIRQRKPGVWEVRVFVGYDDSDRPKQVGRTVRGTKRDAQRAATELTVAPPAAADGRTVADALEAWIETHTPTWAASTVRDQTSRASLVKADRIARLQLARLTVADVDRWHTRLRAAGVGESSLRNQHLVLRSPAPAAPSSVHSSIAISRATGSPSTPTSRSSGLVR
jgi:hypothetical protein